MRSFIFPSLISLLAAGALVSDVVPVEFSTLSGFEWKAGQELPSKARALDGKTIGISGFVRSLDGNDDGITDFWLVDQNCGCAGMPKLNEVILCVMPAGKKLSNDGSPIRVIGSLSVGEEKDGDYVSSIYRLKVERVD